MKTRYARENLLQPHAPDVLERRTADGGFSADWGLHHPPTEHYILDMHNHLSFKQLSAARGAIQEYFARAAAMRLRRCVLVDGKPDTIRMFGALAAKDDRVLWMVWPEHDQPDLKFIKKAAQLPGFCGLKLHNMRIIKGDGKLDAWLSSRWQEIFNFCEEKQIPLLWHVTQRMTDAPYSGGGRNSYWKIGLPKGVRFTNEDLLGIFLQCVQQHPQAPFIGAHHLHVGPTRMASLLKKHRNLYADLSCGNIVRIGDTLLEPDRLRWRAHLLQHVERLMFGTDVILSKDVGVWFNWENLAAHIRFMHQLRLPKEPLEAFMHGNFERLTGKPGDKLSFPDWGGTRA